MTEANTDLVAFDRAKAEEFADLMWGVHHGHACFAYGVNPYWTDEPEPTYKHARWEQHFYLWPSERDQLLAEVAQQLADEPCTDVYVGVLLRQTPERRKGNAASYHMLFADFDKPKLIEAPPVDGAWYAVASGTGYHLYGVLADDPGPELHEEMNRGLRELTGADHKWSDETVLRLPGTNNFKTDPPNPVYLAAGRDGSLPSATVAKAIAAALQASGAGHTPTLAGNYTPVSGELPPSVAEALARDTGDRSADMYAIVAACHDAYFTKSQMMAVLRQHPGSVEKYERRLGFEAGRVWEKLVDQHQLLRAGGWQRGATSWATPDGAALALAPPPDLLANLRTGDWLDKQSFADLVYALPGVIPEGFGLLVGPPKIGKSYFVLALALAVASGGQFLSVATGEARPVLYLALEDGDRRMKDRCRKILGDSPIPANFHYITQATPATVLDIIEDWVKRHAVGSPLVVVDTLGVVMPPAFKGETNYSRDYRIGRDLKAITDASPGMSLLVNHHDRKAVAEDFVDAVSGTHGLAGSADALIVLDRKRLASDGYLRVTGRDVAEGEYAVSFVEPMWRLHGKDLQAASDEAQAAHTTEGLGERSVKIFMHAGALGAQGKPIRASDVVALLKVDSATATVCLTRMEKASRLTRVARGAYTVPWSVGSVMSVISEPSEPTGDGEITDITGVHLPMVTRRRRLGPIRTAPTATRWTCGWPPSPWSVGSVRPMRTCVASVRPTGASAAGRCTTPATTGPNQLRKRHDQMCP